jgi:beta-lactamase regulating signal transducer with metallopeptidase domain
MPGLPANATVVLPSHPWQLLAALRPAAQLPQSVQPIPAPAREIITAPSPTQPSSSSLKVSAKTYRLLPPAASGPSPTIPNSYSSAPAVESHPRPKPSSRFLSLNPIQLAWTLYLSVVLVLLCRLLFGLVTALRLWQTAEPALLDELPLLAAGLHLRSSDDVASPVTIGSGVILPADYETWDAEKLRIVLAHERSHIRQGDFYLQMLATLYATLFWFSPLGWWLKTKLSDLAEAISDRAGLEQAASRSAYAQVLLEFAAAPRPTLIGVAMARTGSLSRRIERLLNDNSFRQSFAATRRRALLAVLLVPIALFAATALIRVEAAGQAPAEPAPPTQPRPPATGVSTPGQPPAPGAPVGADTSELPVPAVPALAGEPALPAPARPVIAGEKAPPVPAAPVIGPGPLIMPPPPPDPDSLSQDENTVMIKDGKILTFKNGTKFSITSPGERTTVRYFALKSSDEKQNENENRSSHTSKHSYRYSYSNNGDSFAIIRGDGKEVQFYGEWFDGHREEFEKARKMAHGDFLWFMRGGKSYFIDDPAVVSQIEAMYKPMDELGKQQEELGRRQEVLGKQQEELGRQQEKASVPTPDMSKEFAELEAAMAKLKTTQGKVMTQDQIAELESKLGDLQGKMGEIQGRIGARQGEFGEQQGKLGAQQGELGAQQGRLGAEQGKIAQEADGKVKSIIDESLSKGTAHPVE